MLKQLDAFDLNGKDLHTRGIEENITDVNALGLSLDKPVVGGSDTHHFMQYGAVITVLNKECSNVTQLKDVIVNKQFTVKIADDLHDRVSEAVRLKEIEKNAGMEGQVR